MQKIQLKAEARELKTRDSKQLRKTGLIPAELYGYKTENTHISVNMIELQKIVREAGESTILELVLPDGSNKNVIIKAIDYHYLTTLPIHVDFMSVNMTEKLTTNIALEFTGEAMAVKALGGTLVTMLNEVEVECLPTDLPQSIEVDISKLETFEDIILVKDLVVSTGVEIKTDLEEPVAKVQEPRDMDAELAEDSVSEEEAVAAVAGEDKAEDDKTEDKE
ncbi:MAG: 50S ribosomal protein L25 [Candidatus Doudnabacteria bacterium]